jgi:hypothetical protein
VPSSLNVKSCTPALAKIVKLAFTGQNNISRIILNCRPYRKFQEANAPVAPV